MQTSKLVICSQMLSTKTLDPQRGSWRQSMYTKGWMVAEWFKSIWQTCWNWRPNDSIIFPFVSLLVLVEHIAPSIKNVITYPCLVLRINLCIFIQNKLQDLVPPSIGCRVHRSPQSWVPAKVSVYCEPLINRNITPVYQLTYITAAQLEGVLTLHWGRRRCPAGILQHNTDRKHRQGARQCLGPRPQVPWSRCAPQSSDVHVLSALSQPWVKRMKNW